MSDTMEVEVVDNQEGRETGPSTSQGAASGQNVNAPPPIQSLQSIRTVRFGRSGHSEFDSSDEREEFVLDSSSEASDDENKMDVDGDAEIKRKKEEEECGWGEIKSDRIAALDWNTAPCVIQTGIKEKVTQYYCYNLFVNDEVINLMVNETNAMAQSKFIRPGYHKDFLSGWMEVTPTEMREFLGLLFFMSCKKLRGYKQYWVVDRDAIGPIAGHIMTETRFQRLLTFWSFGDTGTQPYSKVKQLSDLLHRNFSKRKIPERILYVQRHILHLRDPDSEEHRRRRAKYAQTVLRLMDNDAYTYKLTITHPKSRVSDNKTKAIFDLLNGFLNQGRIIMFKDISVSVELAVALLKQKTYLVGPLSDKSKDIPESLLKYEVQQNEVKGLQNKQGVTIFKWKVENVDKYGLSSFHSDKVVRVEILDMDEKEEFKDQLEFLRDYNNIAAVCRLYNRSSYWDRPLDYDTTWYRKFAVELLINTSVSNALSLYRTLTGEQTFPLFHFQDLLWKHLVGFKWLLHIPTEHPSS